MPLGTLGAIGLGSVGLGMGMNMLGIGQGDDNGLNSLLDQHQRNIMGGQGPGHWEKGPGGKGMLGGFGLRYVPGQMQGPRQAPQAGPAAVAQTSGFRQNQQDLINRLEALSKGQGPSLAAEQLRQATDRNMSQQASIAQTGRGNAALSGITAANNSAQLGAQAASDSAVARIAEQQMALQQLGGAINQGRVADQDLSQFNALQTNYRDQFNIEAQLRARGLDDEAIANIMRMRLGGQKPGTADQLMAGGAGLLSLAGSQGSGKGGGGSGVTPAWNLPRY